MTCFFLSPHLHCVEMVFNLFIHCFVPSRCTNKQLSYLTLELKYAEWIRARFQQEKKPEANFIKKKTKKKSQCTLPTALRLESEPVRSVVLVVQASLNNQRIGKSTRQHRKDTFSWKWEVVTLRIEKKKEENGKTGFIGYRLNFSVVCLIAHLIPPP